MPSHLLHVQGQPLLHPAFETFAGQSHQQLLWWNSKWAPTPSMGAGLSLAQTECGRWWSRHGCCRQTLLGVVCPVILVMTYKDLEVGFNLLVHLLHLSICLWVICLGGAWSHVKECT